MSIIAEALRKSRPDFASVANLDAVPWPKNDRSAHAPTAGMGEGIVLDDSFAAKPAGRAQLDPLRRRLALAVGLVGLAALAGVGLVWLQTQSTVRARMVTIDEPLHGAAPTAVNQVSSAGEGQAQDDAEPAPENPADATDTGNVIDVEMTADAAPALDEQTTADVAERSTPSETPEQFANLAPEETESKSPAIPSATEGKIEPVSVALTPILRVPVTLTPVVKAETPAAPANDQAVVMEAARPDDRPSIFVAPVVAPMAPVMRALTTAIGPVSFAAATAPPVAVVPSSPDLSASLRSPVGEGRLMGVNEMPAPDAGEVIYEATPTPAAINAFVAGDLKSPRGSSASGASVGNSAASRSGSGSTPAWRLEGIFWDSKRPMAVVNDAIVEVGAKVGGAEVLEIRKDCLVLLQGGKRVIIRP